MKKTVFIFAILISMVSCKNDLYYEEFIRIPEETWSNGNILHFNVGISDTSVVYNINITVRNINRYEYSNIFLFVTTHSPDNMTVRDTVGIRLADDQGRWVGKGAASVLSLTYPYRQNIKFPIPGIYVFDIEQAMRVENLKYIADIGVSIENAR